ncbi:MAG: hypothetical protein AAF613_03375 [Pseudomonadota bacterium]
MARINSPITYILTVLLVTAIVWVYLFIAVAVVPLWHTLSGEGVQAWFQNEFGRFAILMVPIHMLSIPVTITAFILNRRGQPGHVQLLWLAALIGLLVCQGFNFILYGGNFNPALSSGTLSPEEALTVLGQWDFYHTVRTFFVCLSLASLTAIFLIDQSQLEAT